MAKKQAKAPAPVAPEAALNPDLFVEQIGREYILWHRGSFRIATSQPFKSQAEALTAARRLAGELLCPLKETRGT